MASHYRRGADFERTTRDDLMGHGYEVLRSAGSKTKIDLVAFKRGEILLTQCKLSAATLSGEDWNRLIAAAALLDDARAVLAYKIPGRAAPAYWHLLTSVQPRRHRRPGIHFEPWSPDPLAHLKERP